MDFLNQLTDNQVALVGCFAVLACCGVLVTLSFHLGRGRNQKSDVSSTYSPTIPFQAVQSASLPEESAEVSQRRAA